MPRFYDALRSLSFPAAAAFCDWRAHRDGDLILMIGLLKELQGEIKTLHH